MAADELEASMLKLLNKINMDDYERTHAEQDVRRAAVIVDLMLQAKHMIHRGGRGIALATARLLRTTRPA